jgi:heme-degrading monooxygenase HmoA
MIARIWHGVTAEAKAEDYLAFLKRTGVKDYQSTSGNRGVYVLHRVRNGQAEFLLVSLWDSVEAVRSFAGNDIEKAKYYPEDKEFLLELEPKVAHYEVLVKP